MKQRCDVLQEQVSGSYFANQPHPVEKESAPFAVDACPLPGGADVLAGKSSSPQVGSGDVFCSERGDVIVSPGVGPMLGEYLLAERVDFDLTDALVPRPLKAKVDAADAREE